MRLHFRPYPIMSVVVLGALFVLIKLGSWQLDRLTWKEEILATIDQRIAAAPTGLDGVLAGRSLEDAEFTPVSVTGRFDHANEIHVFGQAEKGKAGYFIFTPLLRAGGMPVIVNRGFVAMDAKDPASRNAGQISGDVTVTGVVRRPETQTWFYAENDLAKNVWHWRDLPGMSQFAGLSSSLPVYVQATGEPVAMAAPRPLPVRPELTNNHLAYAVTWFGLAIGLVILYLAVHVSQSRLRFSD